MNVELTSDELNYLYHLLKKDYEENCYRLESEINSNSRINPLKVGFFREDISLCKSLASAFNFDLCYNSDNNF